MRRPAVWILVVFLILAATKVAAQNTVNVSATVPGCGDQVVGTGEQCDGSDFDGASCSSLGFTGGVLACTDACLFNTAQCSATAAGGGGSSASGSAGSTIISGQGEPGGLIRVLIDGVLLGEFPTTSLGFFEINISDLVPGVRTFSINGKTFSLAVRKGERTSIADVVAPARPKPNCEILSSDWNRDCRVNEIDFALARDAYLKDPGQVSLRNFSIMAYEWTG